jgi:hypothetical protein
MEGQPVDVNVRAEKANRGDTCMEVARLEMHMIAFNTESALCSA